MGLDVNITKNFWILVLRRLADLVGISRLEWAMRGEAKVNQRDLESVQDAIQLSLW
jgi:hypothetical protein